VIADELPTVSGWHYDPLGLPEHRVGIGIRHDDVRVHLADPGRSTSRDRRAGLPTNWCALAPS
jgi:hypothetical protein